MTPVGNVMPAVMPKPRSKVASMLLKPVCVTALVLLTASVMLKFEPGLGVTGANVVPRPRCTLLSPAKRRT
jgi:hypothetical protein